MADVKRDEEMGGDRFLFATFDVTRQVFFKSRCSIGIVNLKPLKPGHVLMLPRRAVSRLADLDVNEVSDLFQSVQKVGKGLESVYSASALTIALQIATLPCLPLPTALDDHVHRAIIYGPLTTRLQDGLAAGQSVPHVHVHIIPRQDEDYPNKDDIYPALEDSGRRLQSDLESSDLSRSPEKTRPSEIWSVPPDNDRKPRTEEEMEAEAMWLQAELAKHGVK